ncbi:MAG TPA: hypothetical protein VII32_03595 [Thermoanaerobaculia bacterium]|jgi:hypothetical protein
MAKFKIISSKRVDLEHSKFTVEPIVDEPQAGEIFVLTEATGPWEYVIQAVEPAAELRKLACLNWVVEDNQFSGMVASSRQPNATERRRYRRWL